jgi:hypothetical protein
MSLSKKNQKKIEQEIAMRTHLNDIAANENRARSVTVGTAFGGVTDLMMRKHDGSTVWATLQPVEVVELLHQLAAGIGCNLHLQPRQDFASWRSWKTETPEQIKQLNGHPPFASDINPHELLARMLPKPKEQPGLQPALMNINQEENAQLSLDLNERNNVNEKTMAIKKTVNKRTT